MSMACASSSATGGDLVLHHGVHSFPLMTPLPTIPMLPGLKPITQFGVMYFASHVGSCSAILLKLTRSAAFTELDGVRTVPCSGN